MKIPNSRSSSHWFTKVACALFPRVPRDFTFRRGVRIGLRVLHIFTAGTLLAGYIFDQPVSALEPWLFGTVISGFLLLAPDLHASLAVLLEVRGLAVFAKLVLMALVPVFWDARVSLLFAALVIGAVTSHMPGKYRHKVILFHDHIVPDQRRG
jgi:hypothetical protein